MLLRLLVGLSLVTACAVEAFGAAAYMYVTMGTASEVQTHHIGDQGAIITPTPVDIRVLPGPRARRVKVKNCALYVAQADRVQVFRLKSNGRIGEQLRGTEVREGMSPSDFALSDDGRHLYVPQQNEDRVVSYALELTGPDRGG